MSSARWLSLGYVAVVAVALCGSALLSPWAALAVSPAIGLSSVTIARAMGLRPKNLWLIAGLTLLGSLVGVLAAAPGLGSPQEAAAISPTVAMATAVARVLRELRGSGSARG
ncbi:MAG: hypothetical protein GC160_08075 [Acidobacteria bacterium]|nr:hypothetical protein [Acidobacteriota bacterium]